MTLRFGRYEAVGKLGEGAMAAVHLARDPVLDRRVAVKVLHRGVASGKTALQRFFNEAKTVARLANPHVVEVFDFGRQGRDYYLVMEFVDGLSLRGMLHPAMSPGGPGAAPAASPEGHPGRPLPDEITVSLLCQAAEGLDRAARNGVVHRDIKPENLLINSQGYLKVADFGIAHLQDESLTRTGAVLGSPLYMSPEQVRGAKPITSQSDMYSLGAVFHRCLTGSPPFAAPTLKELFRKIAREDPEPLERARPDLDPDLARLVGILLRKDPAQRGEGPRWLRAMLRSWLLARGVDDPMDRVSRHLRLLSGQAHPIGGQGTGRGSLPRTVVSSSPPPPEGGTAAPGPEPTMPDPSAAYRDPDLPGYREPGPVGTRRRQAPGKSREGSAVSRRIPSGWALAAGLGALGVLLGAGFSLWALFGKAHQMGSPRSIEAGPGPVGRAGPLDGKSGLPGQAEADKAAAASSYGSAEVSAGEAPEAAAMEAGRGSGDSRGTPGAATGIRPPAAPNEETGILVVHSAPPFAQVYLDGHDMGVAPVTLANLTPGPHRLLVRNRFGASLDTLLQVNPGKRVLRMQFAAEAVALESPD